eukprot:TRINITY_DN9739_c0_g1_i1.p1 TRINITY_DN9739_c0_g1~~TRINITY_DN9739_c0_g1_i1.p1  ORF type:complete len:1019 (+),score=301.18 TRINITY_DN9739_c0_g1_i1:323-3058(+)
MMVKAYYYPLQKLVKNHPKLFETNVNQIFGNIEQILLLNSQLCDELEERIEHWEEDGQDCVGQIFLKWLPRFKPYHRYGGAYEDSYSKLGFLRENDTLWRRNLDYLEKHVMAIGGSLLADYFITPIQRIPRYIMLIGDLVEFTDKNHPDYPKLKEALKQLVSVAEGVNEHIRQTQSETAIFSVLGRGKGFDKLLSTPKPDWGPRKFLRIGEALRLVDLGNPKKGGSRMSELILFTDILVAGNFVSKKVACQEYYQPIDIMWISTKIPKRIKLLEFLQQQQDESNGNSDAMEVEKTTSDDQKKVRNTVISCTSKTMLPVLYIQGPETNWVAVFGDETERDDWYATILKAMKVAKTEAAQGKRTGVYTFKDGNVYNGEWENGWMHGAGKLCRADGWIFDGHWHRYFKAGFGQVTEQKNTPFYCGWKDINGSVKSLDVHGLWTFGGLTDRDWRVMLSGSQKTQKKAQEKIIAAGSPKSSSFLYKIISGTIKMEKNVSTHGGTKTIKTYLNAPTLIGDMCLLMDTEPADVYAETDVELEFIPLSSLKDLFSNDPGICMRYFQALAKDLAEQLVSLQIDTPPSSNSSQPQEPPPTLPPQIQTPKIKPSIPSLRQTPTLKLDLKELNSEDLYMNPPSSRRHIAVTNPAEEPLNAIDILRKKFQLPQTEVLIDQTDCLQKTAVWKKFGKLYLFQNTLCFDATVFGWNEVECFQFNKFLSVNILAGGALQIILKGGRKLKYMEIKNVDNFSQLLTNIWTDSLKKGTSLVTGPPLSYATPKPHDSLKLTQEDWDLILSAAKIRHYAPGEVIIQEGDRNENLYHIAKGVCQVFKKGPHSEILLGTLDPGTLFGELTFLDAAAAHASVVAQREVSLYVVENHFINILFVNHPQLAGRFYCHLASILAIRVREREQRALKKHS